jgi:hypothetical protein
MKGLCFPYGIFTESRFQHFILLHRSLTEFDAKPNSNPLFLQISYNNISYISNEIQQLTPVEKQRRRLRCETH